MIRTSVLSVLLIYSSCTSSGNQEADERDAGDASAVPADAQSGEASDAGSTEATCRGYATRYWDCCKQHCSWTANVPPEIDTVGTCSLDDVPQEDPGVASSCPTPSEGAGYTCTTMAPWASTDSLSYGFAAVPATGDICGRCYELIFDGTSYNAGDDAGSAALAGKRMVVQAANIGHDVAGGQFDILIPGGGVGLFDACSTQWETGDLGATYGGFLTECKGNLGGGASHDALKTCLSQKCDQIFGTGNDDLRNGCRWFVDWYEVADNPALDYREVRCPDEIVAVSGVDRRPLNDIAACSGGSGSCDQAMQDACDCSWANGGANCGEDDGSCCWTACCAP